MMMNKYCIQLLLFIFFLMIPAIAGANAYCSLRDPIAAIHHLFPEATDHQSIVKTVGKDARNNVSEQLPFTLHFNELGKHTLYVALQDGTPTGLIHARSELSDWGIIEIAWALNLDLSIKNFYIQRCRIPACRDNNIDYLRNKLKDKTFNQINEFLSLDGKTLEIDISDKSKDIRSLSLSIIQSALKTISVTKLVWKDDIEKFNRHTLANKHISAAEIMGIVPKKPPKMSLSEVHNAIGYDSTYIDFNSVKSFQVNGYKGNILGYLAEAEWNVDHYTGIFTLLVSTQGKILAIQPKENWPNKEIKNSFNSIVGFRIRAPSDCNTFAELAASEVYYMSGITRRY